MAVEVDGLLEHAVLLRQRYATGKHAGLGQTRDSAPIIERTETAWLIPGARGEFAMKNVLSGQREEREQ